MHIVDIFEFLVRCTTQAQRYVAINASTKVTDVSARLENMGKLQHVQGNFQQTITKHVTSHHHLK